MNTPLISVIVPIYNVENYLNQCIDSIINQTYKNTEIILIDDGSTDNSSLICDQYASIDSRIKALHIKNGGASHARNIGLDHARGQYIMFIDSDDFIDNTMIEQLLKLLISNHSDIAGCEIKRYIKGNSIDIKEFHNHKSVRVYSPIEILSSMLLRQIDCSPSNKIYKSKIISTLRFPVGSTNEDIVFLFQLYQKCETIVYTNKAYYNYRLTPGSVTATLNEKTFDCLNNATKIEQSILKNNLNLEKEIKYYKIRIAISCYTIIVRNKVKAIYPDYYQQCRNIVLKNIFYIILMKLSIKSKLRLMLSLFS